MAAVKALREALPGHEILADTKIMDAGAYEAAMAFEAGADYCTVLGVTDDFTIKACVEAATARGGAVFVDLICVDDVAERTCTIEGFGVRHIAVHTGVDRQVQGVTPFAEFLQVKAASTSATISVAGGINQDTAGNYREADADIWSPGSLWRCSTTSRATPSPSNSTNSSTARASRPRSTTSPASRPTPNSPTESACGWTNIGAFIAWGLVTALFIPTGWLPNAPPPPPGGVVSTRAGWRPSVPLLQSFDVG